MKKGNCKNILYQHALELIQMGQVVVLDVRTSDEVEDKEGISGNIWIPVFELPQKAKQLIPNRKQPILVYCTTGSKSIFACQILVDMGYEKVYNLQGGLKNKK